MQEISGKLGDFWKKDAEERVILYCQKADENAIVESDGGIRWRTSGNYILDDFCEVLEYAGYGFSREATKVARDRQLAAFAEEYRRNYKGPSEEELAEMRAAFGCGEKVVNILTGDVISL